MHFPFTKIQQQHSLGFALSILLLSSSLGSLGSQGSRALTVPCVVIKNPLPVTQILSQALCYSLRFNSNSSESKQIIFLEILSQIYSYSLQYSKQELLDNLFNSSFTTIGHQKRSNGLSHQIYILQCHRHNKTIHNCL